MSVQEILGLGLFFLGTVAWLLVAHHGRSRAIEEAAARDWAADRTDEQLVGDMTYGATSVLREAARQERIHRARMGL